MASRPNLPTVSLCIPAYNEERNLGRLLARLHDSPLSEGRLLEVLIEPSGSTDQTVQIVQSWTSRWPIVRSIDCGRRLGLAASLERLIETARGELIIRIDADVRVDGEVLDRLLVALQEPGVGIAGPHIIPLGSPSWVVARASAAEWAIHHEVSLIHPKTTVVQAFHRPKTHITFGSSLEDAGLQDEFERLGLRAQYVPEAVVFISPAATATGFVGQRVRTVRIIHDSLRKGRPRPPTAAPGIVLQAGFQVLRRRTTSLNSLAMFGVLELYSRLIARLQSGPTSLELWEPVDGTKEPG